MHDSKDDSGWQMMMNSDSVDNDEQRQPMSDYILSVE
jgi:hypothetical protein